MTEQHKKLMIELRHVLHEHPELSMQETETKRILMEFLQHHTQLRVVDCGRWFYALYEAKRPTAETIAFRADFDALPMQGTCQVPWQSKHPGVGHQCGHDGHSAALAGFALEVDEKGADQNICFLFQHAEETGQGAEECVVVLAKCNVSRIFAVHNRSGYPRGTIVYRRGLIQCASKGLTVKMTGKISHASEPEKGKNPAFAIALLVTYIEKLLQSKHFEDMVLCTIVQVSVGQKDFGISAGDGEVSMTLRANQEKELDQLERMICKKAVELAKEEGLEVAFAVSDPFPETRNEDSSIEMVEKAAEALRKPTMLLEEPWRASEDFGYYTKQCPGAMFYVGNGVDYPALHTGDYDFPDEILETIVDMYGELIKG